MSNQTATTHDYATVVQEVLSDGSAAWNVEYRDHHGNVTLTIGATSRAKAIKLAQALNDAAWVMT